MGNHKFSSAADAAATLCGVAAVKDLVEQEMTQSRIVNKLLHMRTDKKVSQKELAQRMGCDPSKISRMEAGNDLQLKIGDIAQYVTALGVQMTTVFEDTTLPVAEQIKRDVNSIHEKLERLVGVAKQVDGDETIINKINIFYGEVLLNFMLRFTDSHEKLKDISGYSQPQNPSTIAGAVEIKSGTTEKAIAVHSNS
ncbi:MAG: helix-turn-helix domain-containing protein [Chlorobiaceae bacterium]|nr:helix-turn-helix domain-containing protein [Chlorobiaceae bacterium]